MDRMTLAATAVLISLACSACTSDGIKRAAYEAAYQKGCMDRSATPNCDPEHQTYEDYSRGRPSQ
jgi:hypothetical protein